MIQLQTHIQNYLEYCRTQKRLDAKTLKAYRIDLTQFACQFPSTDIQAFTPDILETFIAALHEQYKPKTIPLHTLEQFLAAIYREHAAAKTAYSKRTTLRDIAVAELLFVTGMRISELCSLHVSDVNLYDGTILIYGKGSKERRIQLGNDDVVDVLLQYRDTVPDQRTIRRILFHSSVRQGIIRPVRAPDAE